MGCLGGDLRLRIGAGWRSTQKLIRPWHSVPVEGLRDLLGHRVMLRSRLRRDKAAMMRRVARFCMLRATRTRLGLTAIVLGLAVSILLHSGGNAQTGAPQEWVTPREVLVLYNASWPDENEN